MRSWAVPTATVRAVQDAICPNPLGKSDGYLMVLQWKE